MTLPRPIKCDFSSHGNALPTGHGLTEEWLELRLAARRDWLVLAIMIPATLVLRPEIFDRRLCERSEAISAT